MFRDQNNDPPIIDPQPADPKMIQQADRRLTNGDINHEDDDPVPKVVGQDRKPRSLQDWINLDKMVKENPHASGSARPDLGWSIRRRSDWLIAKRLEVNGEFPVLRHMRREEKQGQEDFGSNPPPPSTTKGDGKSKVAKPTLRNTSKSIMTAALKRGFLCILCVVCCLIPCNAQSTHYSIKDQFLQDGDNLEANPSNVDALRKIMETKGKTSATQQLRVRLKKKRRDLLVWRRRMSRTAKLRRRSIMTQEGRTKHQRRPPTTMIAYAPS